MNQFSQNKIFFHDNKLSLIRKGKMTLPSVLELSLCGYCNHDCIYCCCTHCGDMLKRSEIDSIIQQAKSFVKAITITGGGEPTLNPEFQYCIEALKENNIPTGVITNGSTLSLRQMEQIVLHASFCRISLDSADDSIYKSIRKAPFTVSSVLNNLSILAMMKREYKSKILIGTQIVLIDQELDDIENTLKMVKEQNVDFVQIRPVDNVPYREFEPDFYYYQSKRADLQKIVEKFCDKSFSIILNVEKLAEYYNTQIGKEYIGCPGANYTASIGHDNNVYFCCSHIGDNDYLLGSLAKDNLSSILSSPKRNGLILNCTHSGCQNQCRNHNNNKLISRVMNMSESDFKSLEVSVLSTGKPTHWQFL